MSDSWLAGSGSRMPRHRTSHRVKEKAQVDDVEHRALGKGETVSRDDRKGRSELSAAEEGSTEIRVNSRRGLNDGCTLLNGVLQGIRAPGLERNDFGKLHTTQSVLEDEGLQFVPSETVGMGVGIEGQA
jgi:hypothetical protein